MGCPFVNAWPGWHRSPIPTWHSTIHGSAQHAVGDRIIELWNFGFLSVKFESRFFAPGQPGRAIVGSFATLFSLLLGWWGIPWGPIWTIKGVIRNLAGGRKIRVDSLLVPGDVKVVSDES